MKNKNIINKIKVFVFMIIILTFIIFNEQIMPVRKEITSLELVKVIGMDKIDDGKYKVEQTIVRVPTEEQSSSGSSGSKGSGGSSSESKPKSFSVKGVSYSDIIRSLQTYLNKRSAGSHIKYMILGEDLCKDDMVPNLDFNFRHYDVRLNANIYIAKKSTAKDFINQVGNSEYSIDEKIKSMEQNNETKSASYETSIIDVMSMLANKNACGLIPTLEIISENKNTSSTQDLDESNNIQDFQPASLDPQGNLETIFDFGGYAIINQRKLAGYLSRKDSITCNLMKNQIKGSNINIDLGNDNTVTFGIFTSNTGYNFKFDGDNLSEVTIKNSIKVNYEEVKTEEDVTNDEKIEELENKISSQIKSEIENIILEMKQYNCDFVNINEYCKTSHPFKFQKIENNWTEQLLNAKFNVETDAKILRTYDVLQIK